MTEYWLPSWWDWMQDWSDCIACMKYNHSRRLSCEIPPGLLGLAQLVGGGTAAVAGRMSGNVGIASARQAKAAARVSGAEAVNKQIQRQQNVTVNIQNVNVRGAQQARKQAKRQQRGQR